MVTNPDDSWTAIGSWTNSDNGSSLFATTNGNGGVYLYYANGSGAANSIVRVTDQSIMGSINIISTNTIYTAPAGTTVIGLTFVPVPTAYAATLIPPPILTAQTCRSGSPSVSRTPRTIALWRSSITGITVNGSACRLVPITPRNRARLSSIHHKTLRYKLREQKPSSSPPPATATTRWFKHWRPFLHQCWVESR